MALLIRNLGCTRLFTGVGTAFKLKAPKLTPWLRPMAATVADQQGESFWNKNKRLQRPISPHLTIYKWEITMNMSLMHRITGMLLTGGVYGFALSMLVLPSNYAHYVSEIQALHLPSSVLFATKFLLAFPLVFHMCSGTRHLFWDLGKGFEMKSVYASGYAAVALALALTVAVASL